jgi:hypothetical protein
MKSNMVSLNGNNIVLSLLGILAAGLVFAVLTGRQLPVLAGDRAAFFVLLIVGFIMCSVGSLRNIQPHEWVHPMNLLASLLGVMALLLGAALLTGFNLPLISGDRDAFVILAVILFSKVLLATVHHTLLTRLA